MAVDVQSHKISLAAAFQRAVQLTLRRHVGANPIGMYFHRCRGGTLRGAFGPLRRWELHIGYGFGIGDLGGGADLVEIGGVEGGAAGADETGEGGGGVGSGRALEIYGEAEYGEVGGGEWGVGGRRRRRRGSGGFGGGVGFGFRLGFRV